MSKKEEVKTEMVEEEKVLTTEEIIVQVLDSYLQQEIGNKVSQFSVQGLMSLMLGSIAQNKQEG
jgi:hypothetical protein